jgi:hypothetical protein
MVLNGHSKVLLFLSAVSFSIIKSISSEVFVLSKLLSVLEDYPPFTSDVKLLRRVTW